MPDHEGRRRAAKAAKGIVDTHATIELRKADREAAAEELKTAADASVPPELPPPIDVEAVAAQCLADKAAQIAVEVEACAAAIQAGIDRKLAALNALAPEVRASMRVKDLAQLQAKLEAQIAVRRSALKTELEQRYGVEP